MLQSGGGGWAGGGAGRVGGLGGWGGWPGGGAGRVGCSQFAVPPSEKLAAVRWFK